MMCMLLAGVFTSIILSIILKILKPNLKSFGTSAKYKFKGF